MTDSQRLLARLRDHVGRTVRRCPACDPGEGVYCLRAEPIAEQFAEARAEEVVAGRAARRVGAGAL